MIFAPSPIGKKTLDEEKLKTDKQGCRKFGPCGVGKEALYLGGRFIDRRYYIPWKEVKRVFKRVAMSAGGFSGKGLFGSMAFLVVQFGGEEKECPFKFEADVDRLLACVEQEHPDIPTHSVKAQNKLAKAEAAEEARFLKELSPEASAAVETLKADKDFLEIRPSLCASLTDMAKLKRVADNISPTYRAVGTIVGVIGIAAVLYGLYGVFTHSPIALYLLIGGGAAFGGHARLSQGPPLLLDPGPVRASHRTHAHDPRAARGPRPERYGSSGGREAGPARAQFLRHRLPEGA